MRLLTKAGAWHGTLVLNYHRIARANSHPPGESWSATVDELDAQLRYLSRHVEFARPGDLLERPTGRGRSVMLTFDDGYRDNYELALPVLRSLDVPAVFFIATGFIDRPSVSWWDEIAWMVEHSPRSQLTDGSWVAGAISLQDGPAAVTQLVERYKQLPADETRKFLDWLADATGSGRQSVTDSAATWMTWDMVRELLAAGMSIGGHTVNHPVLARLSLEEQRQEILECRDRLHTELGIPMELFAYPVGLPDSFDERTVACLREAGVRLAFSYYGGYMRPEMHNPYDIPRTSVWLGMLPTRFRAVAALPQVFARC